MVCHKNFTCGCRYIFVPNLTVVFCNMGPPQAGWSVIMLLKKSKDCGRDLDDYRPTTLQSAKHFLGLNAVLNPGINGDSSENVEWL